VISGRPSEPTRLLRRSDVNNGPAPPRVTRRWTSGAWAVRGRMISEGLSGLGLFEKYCPAKYRREKNSGMGSRISKHAGAGTNECHKSSLR
jgi:hypothetical protein